MVETGNLIYLRKLTSDWSTVPVPDVLSHMDTAKNGIGLVSDFDEIVNMLIILSEKACNYGFLLLVSGDQMAKDLVNYAEYETMSLTLKKGFTHFAENLSTIQDYREAQVGRLTDTSRHREAQVRR